MIRIGIIAATFAEAKLLTSKPLKQNSTISVNNSCSLYLAGMGKDNALSACRALHKQGCHVLVSWGTVAAISNHLKSGDLILSPEARNTSGKNYFTDKSLNQTLQSKFLTEQIQVHQIPVLQVDQVISSISEKKELSETHNSKILDMESADITAYANQNGLSALIIRSVCDDANMVLPHSILDNINSFGRVDLFGLLLSLLKHPYEIRHLIHLGIAYKKSANTLKQCASILLSWVDEPENL